MTDTTRRVDPAGHRLAHRREDARLGNVNTIPVLSRVTAAPRPTSRITRLVRWIHVSRVRTLAYRAAIVILFVTGATLTGDWLFDLAAHALVPISSPTRTPLPTISRTSTPVPTPTPTDWHAAYIPTATAEPARMVAAGWLGWWGIEGDTTDRDVYLDPNRLSYGAGTITPGTPVNVCWSGQAALDQVGESIKFDGVSRCTSGTVVATQRSGEPLAGVRLIGMIGAGVRRDLGCAGKFNLCNVRVYTGGFPAGVTVVVSDR